MSIKARTPPSKLYSIQSCIGRGNFGDVYKAMDRTTQEIVAIKVVNLEHSDEDIELLAQEIFFLAELKSPLITNYITTMLEDVSMWIVMEYCGGGSCSDLLKRNYVNGLPEEKVSFIIHQVTLGLKYLHEQRKIHRDIKAANILLNEEGMVKLGDFGVSGHIRSTMKRDTFVGTPYWMAPEVVCCEVDGYNEKADIWSLGITTYELLKGLPPLSKYDPMKVMTNLPKRKPPKLQGSFSEAAKEFVAGCLVKAPADRPSAYDLLSFDFIRNVTITNLKSDVDLIKQKKVQERYTKIPKYPLQNRLYKNSNTARGKDFWNFESTRTTAIQTSKNELSPITQDSPVSSLNMESPYLLHGQTVTPITNPNSSSFRKCNKPVFELDSGMDIDSGCPHLQTEIEMITPSNHNKKHKKNDIQALKIEKFDYLENIVSHILNRMYDRARDDETRKYVDEMLKQFIKTEANVPGFNEVFIEEISLRIEAIRKGFV